MVVRKTGASSRQRAASFVEASPCSTTFHHHTLLASTTCSSIHNEGSHVKLSRTSLLSASLARWCAARTGRRSGDASSARHAKSRSSTKASASGWQHGGCMRLGCERSENLAGNGKQCSSGVDRRSGFVSKS